MPFQSRYGDQSQVPSDAHSCTSCPHTAVGPAITGSPNVNVNNMKALRVGDTGQHASCCGPQTWVAVTGSGTVFINGMPAHRLNDQDQHCGGMGFMIQASSNVKVGG